MTEFIKIPVRIEELGEAQGLMPGYYYTFDDDDSEEIAWDGPFETSQQALGAVQGVLKDIFEQQVMETILGKE